MPISPVQNPNILITEVTSYLGYSLAQFLIAKNCSVWGVGNSQLSEDLLTAHNFTFLDIDLSQPLPVHLPQFDFIFYLESAVHPQDYSQATAHPKSSSLTNIIDIAANSSSNLYIFTKIESDTLFFERLKRDEKIANRLKLFMVGDLYGPKMPLSAPSQGYFAKGELAQLISQAVSGNKVILENEGLNVIYPIYITDFLEAVDKFVFDNKLNESQVAISQHPKTTLSIAYEIQNIMNLVSGKQIGLFFSGSKSRDLEPTPPQVPKLNFSPKIDLKQGLEATFEYFKDEKLIKASADTPPKKEMTRRERLQKIITENTPDQPSRMPKFKIKPRTRLLFAAVIVVLLLTVTKGLIDIYFGVNSLKSAKKSAYEGDFQKAKNKAQKSVNSFKSASVIFKYLSFPLSPVLKNQVSSLNTSLLAATEGSLSFKYFTEGVEILARNYTIILQKDIKSNDGLDLELPSAHFKRAYFAASHAQELAGKVTAPVISSKIEEAKNNLITLSQLSSSMYELSHLTDNLTGSSLPKTYLVLLQNNKELRPGGGFIGNFGLVKFANNRLENITIEDIYTVDGQLKEKIEPPKELKEKLGVDNFYLRDSNWSTDFNLNAATARDLYRKETGQEVDGVIAMDLSYIQKILAGLGPIKLDDFNETITAENLFERGLFYSEVGFFPGSTQKRDFFGALSRALIAKITENPKNAWLPLAEASKDSLLQKHMTITFDDAQLSSYVKVRGWDHPLPPANFDPQDDNFETRDFLAFSEANLGANKANHFLERKISYEATIGRDANLVGKLTIFYKNNSQAETWPAGNYVNFLRVHTTVGAGLISIKNGDNTDLKTVETSTTGSLTTFSTFVEVPTKSSKELILTYRISKNIKLETAPIYHLYVQKQPGTDQDHFEFTFNLPSYLAQKETGKQNLKLATDLLTDREFKIDIVKK